MSEPATLEDALAVLQVYQRQLEGVTNQLELLEAVLDETARARETLEGLREEGEDVVLIPVGAQTYLRGKVTDLKVALAGIGAGYSVEKPWDESTSRLSKREEEVRGEIARLSQAAGELQSQATRLQADLDRALEGASAPGNGDT